MVNRDVVLTKVDHLKRNLARLKEKQGVDLSRFLADPDLQDIVLMNLQAAIQNCIDIAGHIISDQDWGVAGSLAGLFDLLWEKKVITEETREMMRSMAGFRNLIVHEYAELDLKKVYEVFTTRLGDFDLFLEEVAAFAKL